CAYQQEPHIFSQESLFKRQNLKHEDNTSWEAHLNHVSSLTPSVGTNERPCALPEHLIFMRPAHPYPHWGDCIENKCVLINKSLTSSSKRALLKDKTPSMGTIPLGRHI
ncbi:hypothetical protein Taro_002532, partial [Colocasia esculenta]|nr:hypothetical protein [Colocasia esculenta]